MTSENKKMDRRSFLKATGIGSASLAVTAGIRGSGLASEPAKDNSSKKMPTRILGKTGASLSILGMGGDVDYTINQVLLRMSLTMGINYWDTSHLYENGKSEIGIGQYFGKYPEDRKKVFLVTKATDKNDPEGMTERLNLSLERLQTDYIDLYFMHNLMDTKLLTPEIKAWAEQKKKEGKIRFFGFSFHLNNAKMLMHASTLDWIDAVMSLYNYQVIHEDDIKRGIDACAKANIGIIAIKTQGKTPDAQETPQALEVTKYFMDKGYTLEQAKLKAVWENENITAIASLISNMTILKDNVAAALDNKPLSSGDINILNSLAANNKNLYCKGCIRCESVMDSESRIADILRYMMYFNSYGRTDDARRFFRELPEHVRKSLTAMDYSHAEHVCPNKIQIGKAMKEAARILG